MVELAVTTKESKERLNVGKVLILGGSGLVGQRFLELFDGEFVTPSHSELDITDAKAVKEFISREKPDVVINFAADTNVNDEEKQRDNEGGDCWRINVEGVRNILDAIDLEKTRFIQISTDMVFSGSPDDPGPYSEDHLPETNPDKLTWYGFTKAEAERLVQERLGDNATIVRIIYPVRKEFKKKLDYLRFPLEKFKKEDKLYPLFTDQQVSITFIDEACEALRRIIENKLTGVFHVSSPDTTTPYKLISKFIKKALGKEIDFEKGTVSNPRRYPLKGGLDPRKTEEVLDMNFSTTDEIINKLI